MAEDISPHHPLKIAAIQFQVTKAVYGSKAMFHQTISALLQEIVDTNHPDLIIFPEYTLVFLALLPFTEEIYSSDSAEQAFMKIKQNHPLINSIKDIFINNAHFVKNIADELFGTLSKKHNLYIIAGTYFSKTTFFFSKPRLCNTALVYNPQGICFYSQDKVFLTDFEKQIIGLSEGNMESVQGFKIDGWEIGFTICRDTYESKWEDQFSTKDLWIDIKANGTSFTEQERDSFKRALPTRLLYSHVPLGITLCLTGNFFQFAWEGESSCIKKNSTGIEYIKTSNTATEEEILYVHLDPP